MTATLRLRWLQRASTIILLWSLFPGAITAAQLSLHPVALATNASREASVIWAPRGSKPLAEHMVLYRASAKPLKQRLWLAARVIDDDGLIVRNVGSGKWDLAIDEVLYRGAKKHGQLAVEPCYMGKEGMALVLVVNQSPSVSMQDKLVQPLTSLVEKFLKELRSEGLPHQVGMIGYGIGAVEVRNDISTEFSSVPASVSLDLKQTNDPETVVAADIVGALDRASEILRGFKDMPRRGIVLFTDGEDIEKIGAQALWSHLQGQDINTPRDQEVVVMIHGVGPKVGGKDMIKTKPIADFLNIASSAHRRRVVQLSSAGDAAVLKQQIKAALAPDYLISLTSSSADYPPADESEHRVALSVNLEGKPVQSSAAPFFTIRGTGFPPWQLALLLGCAVLLVALAGIAIAMGRLRPEDGRAAENISQSGREETDDVRKIIDSLK